MIAIIGWIVAATATGLGLFALAKREDEPARVEWIPGQRIRLDWDKKYWLTYDGIPSYIRVDHPEVVKVQWDPPTDDFPYAVVKLIPFAVGEAQLTINDESMTVRVK